MNTQHLQKLCRVCGNNVYEGKTPRQHKCCDHQGRLDIALDIEIHTCKNVIYCHKRKVTGRVMEKKIAKFVIHHW